jgi:arylsulfatase A-like enzyme
MSARLVVLFIAVPLHFAACTPADSDERIVLVTLDTTRADALSPGNDGRVPLARTAAWAQQGRRFTRCYAASSTTQPTHASLFTGLHPWEHGVPRNGAVLLPGFPTLAERLQAAGFATAAVVASFPVDAQFGFSRGFDRYQDDFSHGSVSLWSGVEPEAGPGPFWSPAHVVQGRIEGVLDSMPLGRQFVWFHFFDPHGPYGDSDGESPGLGLVEVRERIRRGEDGAALARRARSLYESDLRSMDRALGALFERLDADAARGIETHVVLIADHGESFGEGGSLGHGKRLTREQIEVPCVVRSSRVAAGESAVPVGTVDFHATLLDLAGLPHEGHGRSLLGDRLEPAPVLGMRRTFPQPYRDLRVDGSVVVIEGLQFYVADEAGVVTGNAEAVERFDLGGDVPAKAADAARRRFAGFARALAARTPHEPLDDATRRRLEALGYLGEGERPEALGR